MKTEYWWRKTVPLNAQELSCEFDYNPETGCLFRKTKTGQYLAGYPNNFGYLVVGFKGKKTLVHRIAWTLATGFPPDGELDHVNGDRSDNRISNLRPATRSQNLFNKGPQSNSTSGVKGVSWSKRDKRWTARIRANGKYQSVGSFKTIEQASQAYQAKARELHGEFYREKTR